jgi:hypothetical protein
MARVLAKNSEPTEMIEDFAVPVFAQKPIRAERALIRDCAMLGNLSFSESGRRDRQNREPRS